MGIFYETRLDKTAGPALHVFDRDRVDGDLRRSLLRYVHQVTERAPARWFHQRSLPKSKLYYQHNCKLYRHIVAEHEQPFFGHLCSGGLLDDNECTRNWTDLLHGDGDAARGGRRYLCDFGSVVLDVCLSELSEYQADKEEWQWFPAV